ncbi:hypothetical protein L6452_35720 [Arctium lappa]|uniref:Uncharacterized protein n=1 Tax=Arctium lappa TaxID=4217 RepID=A0ACB8Y779_ARCLA|nr:hypothetical protein L6452_35720 [Arctium lappa]
MIWVSILLPLDDGVPIGERKKVVVKLELNTYRRYDRSPNSLLCCLSQSNRPTHTRTRKTFLNLSAPLPT